MRNSVVRYDLLCPSSQPSERALNQNGLMWLKYVLCHSARHMIVGRWFGVVSGSHGKNVSNIYTIQGYIQAATLASVSKCDGTAD